MVKTIPDVFVYILLLVGLFFLSANFDPTIALVFTIGLVITIFYYSIDKHHSIVIESKPDRMKSLMYAVIGYLIVIGASAIINGVGFFSILEVMAETQASLALTENIVVSFILFAVIIAIIETSVIGTILELLKDFLKIDFTKLNFKLVLTFFIISLGFMFMHLSAKGITNTAALITVFIFGLVTSYMIYKEGQMLGAMLMHIIANATALIIAAGFFAEVSTAIIVGIVVVGGIVYLMRRLTITQRSLF